MNNTLIHPNTPKGYDGEIANIPSAFVVDEFVIKNYAGMSKDINTILLSFTLTEELFSPVIILNARIRDTVNFFEDFEVKGQETISLKCTKVDSVSGRKRQLELSFTVKEYPNYEKSVESLGAQEYNLIAVSDFAYVSALTRISRAVDGNPVDAIKAILRKDLNVDKVKQESKHACVTSFKGVINIQSPLKAIEWLRGKSYDANKSPFFIYSTISDTSEIHIGSWSGLVEGSTYPSDDKPYEYKQYLESRPNTPAAYSESMGRVLNMKSTIKLDKLDQAINGGYGSTLESSDFALKSWVQNVFAPNVKKGTKADILKDTFAFLKSGGKEMVKAINTPKGVRVELQTNTTSNNSTSVRSSFIQAGKYNIAKLDDINHEIVVYGDFKLNPGRKIRIEIPKSADPVLYEKEIAKKSGSFIDESLSGYYIVAVAAHTFINGVYTTRLKIIKIDENR